MGLRKPTVTPTVSADIEKVRRRLQAWRRRRKHRSRIPESLWRSATKLARRYPPARIAHTLGLDYDALKERLETANRHSTRKQQACPQPGRRAVDFRNGIDGLARVCKQVLRADPFSGCLVVFRNRRGTAIKVLTYDGQGFWLAHKRLSSGRFRFWPSSETEVCKALE
ncbi:MAG: IS66 family insertion sequence element accessory protein TnpB, partial [Deltaproteobacteria bacterium]|nr:IS66 family insertion sequence element accessory protein TnpB [Deltaproteobacteria bacterium]